MWRIFCESRPGVNTFLCRAINPEHAGLTVTLKDVQAARAAHRRKVRQVIKEKRGRVVDLLPTALRPPTSPSLKSEMTSSPRPRLRTYVEDQ